MENENFSKCSDFEKCEQTVPKGNIHEKYLKFLANYAIFPQIHVHTTFILFSLALAASDSCYRMCAIFTRQAMAVHIGGGTFLGNTNSYLGYLPNTLIKLCLKFSDQVSFMGVQLG